MIITENNNKLVFFFPLFMALISFSSLKVRMSRILFNNRNESGYVSTVLPLAMMLAVVKKKLIILGLNCFKLNYLSGLAY